MNTIKTLLLSVGLAVFATTVLADDDDHWRPGSSVQWYRTDPSEYRIHELLEHQHRQIERAVRHDRLRPKDARRLFHRQERLIKMEDHFASDGWLSPHELRILEHKIHKLDDRILRKQYNRHHWAPAKHNRWHPAGHYYQGSYERHHQYGHCDTPDDAAYSRNPSGNFYRRINFSW